MTTPFNDLYSQAATIIVDRLSGVVAEIVPRVSGTYQERAGDPDRETVTVKGKLTIAPKIDNLKGRGKDDFTRKSSIALGQAEFYIAPAAYAALGVEVKRGDLIRFPTLPNCPQYAVINTKASQTGAMELILANEDYE